MCIYALVFSYSLLSNRWNCSLGAQRLSLKTDSGRVILVNNACPGDYRYFRCLGKNFAQIMHIRRLFILAFVNSYFQCYMDR